MICDKFLKKCLFLERKSDYEHVCGLELYLASRSIGNGEILHFYHILKFSQITTFQMGNVSALCTYILDCTF